MRQRNQKGFTLVEVMIAFIVLAIISIGLFSLIDSLISSIIVARRQSVALSLATSQLEYLKSLPYDSLAVQGGSIYTQNPLPASKVDTVNGVYYKTSTRIAYSDDAYDGCTSYPTLPLKEQYCRNYPPPAAAPALDQNAGDYKIVTVTTEDKSGNRLSKVSTTISARVAESASTTGALFVKVLDADGAPVSGVTLAITNTTITPQVSLGDSTDSNGVAIFYNLPPDSGNDYRVVASKSGFSTLATIIASGALQPTYANQKILAQQSSSVTLTIAPMASRSLIVETVDTNGNPLSGLRTYIKGGYKKYTAATDTAYYFDNIFGSDVRPTSDASGLASVEDLPPINGYVFCGDLGDTSCTIGGTRYYLAAAVPYTGENSLQPITIPSGTTPATLPQLEYGGNQYAQKVRLILTTSSVYPRVFTVSPDQVNRSTATAQQVTVSGINLGSATMAIRQGSNTYSGTSCVRTATAGPPIYDQVRCTFDLSTLTDGVAELRVTNASGTLVLPTDPLGGINVVP